MILYKRLCCRVMDVLKLRAFFQTHVFEVTTACKTEFRYGWDDHKKLIDPLIAVNSAFGIDNTELKRAVRTLEDAQLNLRSVRDEYLARLQREVNISNFCEDLT